MSKKLPLQCLFCNLCNVASAKYCNECASPLHLQPCNQCGAIDNRTASNCYKCGEEFNVPAAPVLASVPVTPKRARVPATAKRARVPAASKRVLLPAAPELAPAPAVPELAAVPAASVPESESAPPIADHQVAKPMLDDGGFAIERAFLSKSSAQVVGTFRQGSRREQTGTEDQAAGVADWGATHVSPDPAHSAAEPQPMDRAVARESVERPAPLHSVVEPLSIDDTVALERVQYPVLALSAVEPQLMESERVMTATAQRARRLAFLTLLLAATAVSAYYYYDRSAQQPAQGQSAGQPTPRTPDGPISAGATTATVATQVDAPSAPKDTTSQPTTGAEKVEKAPSPAASVVAKPRADPGPVPVNRSLDAPAAVSGPAATPQAANAASSARRSSVIDGDVKSRRDPPTFKECTEAVAALGFCGPIKP